MEQIIILISGILIGCLLSRYFIGVGNKISMNAQDGVAINKKVSPTEQEFTN